VAVFLCLGGTAGAQEKPAESDVVAQANNPLARITALNLHNYYIGELTDPDENANQFFMRFVKAFSIGKTDWIMRASLPINTFPVEPSLDKQTGLGDLTAFAAYLFPLGNPKISFGVGPQLTVPTATDELGSDKWSLGLSNILFVATSPKFQYGYLLTWQASIAGAEDRPDVNVGAFQYFLVYQLGGGRYLRSSPIMTYDFENDAYSVPIGLGFGQVIPAKKVVYNFFVEPQYSIADEGAGWPKWQIFFALNMQFR
jgi:hypothetical protein